MKWPLPHPGGTRARPTFSEAWFRQRCGMSFGRDYCFDPITRTEQDRAAMRYLHTVFGHLGLGEADPAPRPHLEICGHRLLPALLGAEVVFQDDQAPATLHRPFVSPSSFVEARLPNWDENVWVIEFRRQGGCLIDRYGQVDARINIGGPLNVAANLFGTDVFLHLSDKCADLDGLLARIARLAVESFDRLVRPFSPKMPPGREMFIGNCPVYMLDPQTYRQRVLPHDRYIRRHTERFGLHNCGHIDRYLEAYHELAPLEFIEVGWGSNLRAVRRSFPVTPLSILLHVSELARMDEKQIEQTVGEAISQALPAKHIRDVWLPDIGLEMSDGQVEAFVRAVDRSLPPESQ